jgi:hypothetical protein
MKHIYIRPKNLNKLHNFYIFFKNLTKKKYILISQLYVTKNNNILNISILFFSTLLTSLSIKKNIFFKKQFKFFKTTIIIFKIFNLNLLISKNKIKLLSKKLYKFKNNIFNYDSKSFNIFLHLTVLLMLHKLNIKIYINYLLKIFKLLKKNQHSKFFLFLKFLIKNIINTTINLFTLIKGIKIVISGRLKGKPRSSNIKITDGKVRAMSLKSKMEYGCLDVFNRYGTFGLKLWINY